ncbi:MAG: hypothetical protein IPJ88_08875 [Myxococcales bacterium]|nr:MAG: hypothetical protein IPJ88_08875 [Myxococcales bacterium]
MFVNLSPIPLVTEQVIEDTHLYAHDLSTYAATAILALLILMSMWRVGVGAWFRTVGDFLAKPDHEHRHSHS